MLDSTTLLASKCSPNAFSLNLIIIFCTNPRAFEDCGVGAAENLQTPSQCPARCSVNGFSGQRVGGRLAAGIRSRHRDAVPVRLCGTRGGGRSMPDAKSPEEREVVAAEARVFRQSLQLARV